MAADISLLHMVMVVAMAADIALLHMEMAVQLAADIALLHMVMAVQLASALLLVADHTSPSHKLALVVAVASARRPELGLVSEQELVESAQLGLEQGQAQGKESVAGPVVQQAQDTGLEQVCPQSLAQQLFGLRM